MISDDPIQFLRLSKEDLRASLSKLKEDLQTRSPEDLTQKTGSELKTTGETTTLILYCFSKKFTITLPEFSIQDAQGKAADLLYSGFIIHYLATADGTPSSGKWISLREIPGGTFYADAFQGYTGDVLVRTFGGKEDQLIQACRENKGEEIDLGDFGYSFQLLPRVKLGLVYWRGDEEFPPSARILFDGSSPHYLPCDALAVMGAQLTRDLCLAL